MAARLALLGLGRVGDGALVGCVIAQGEEVVSVGAHRRFGGRHAETRALAGASSRGKDIKGATAYVPLARCAPPGNALRGRVDAILTGMGTVMTDDPALTARHGTPRTTPMRVVLDSDLDIPLDRQLVRTAKEVPTIVCCEAKLASAAISETKRAELAKAGVRIAGCPAAANGASGLDLQETMRTLYSTFGITTVLVEGGAGLLGSLFEADAVDTAIAYIAPLLLGDERARSVVVGRVAPVLASGVSLRLGRIRRVGEDVELTYCRSGVDSADDDAPEDASAVGQDAS